MLKEGLLSHIDIAVIAAYLIFCLAMSVFFYKFHDNNNIEYFLGGRSFRWWWVGSSIAATTFAADTPLAITGLIASHGLSGNWIWLSWILYHATVVFLTARGWRRSEVITDSQFIELRYSGSMVKPLRLFKSGFYAVVFNCIILGWVVKAMAKIVGPFFHWDQFFPSFYSWSMSLMPQGTPLGTVSDTLTVVLLMAIATLYSSIGGLRAVMTTDLYQFIMSLVGSYLFAYLVLKSIGGLHGLRVQLSEIYGQNHQFLNLFSFSGEGQHADIFQWGAIGVGLYFVSQAYSNAPADGGGYLMQRLGACRSNSDAQKSALFFVVLQYVVRVWPWFIVGLGALVLIPLGQEGQVFEGALSYVGLDREKGYSALMAVLLSPGILGLVIVGMLSAFMSTVDTHLNWGASYIINDIVPLLTKDKAVANMAWSRITTFLFFLLALVSASFIDSIGNAWKVIAVLGVGFAPATLGRWLWWRVTALSEVLGALFGFVFAGVSFFIGNISFEVTLCGALIAATAGVFIGIRFGPKTELNKLQHFYKTVRPHGFWKPVSADRRNEMNWKPVGGIVSTCGAVLVSLYAGQLVLQGFVNNAFFWAVTSTVLFICAIFFMEKEEN